MRAILFGIFWAFANPRKFWSLTLLSSWLVVGFFAVNEFIKIMSLA